MDRQEKINHIQWKYDSLREEEYKIRSQLNGIDSQKQAALLEYFLLIGGFRVNDYVKDSSGNKGIVSALKITCGGDISKFYWRAKIRLQKPDGSYSKREKNIYAHETWRKVNDQ